MQLYSQLGMKLTKFHRVLVFKQSQWSKPYVKFNIEKTKKASNSFDKYFCKLINNIVRGEAVETLEKEWMKNLSRMLKSIKNFVSQKMFNKHLMAVRKINEVLTLNKPAYAGMCILDLSKTLRYYFHYYYIVTYKHSVA